MEESAIVGIDYDEFDSESYRAVTVLLDRDKPSIRFETSDVTKDYEDAMEFAYANAIIVMCSSSVDNFLSDTDFEYTKLPEFIKYEHHNRNVSVRSKLKGRHRDFCLCHSCVVLDLEDIDNNCYIAREVFDLCKKNGLVLPVWECPYFSQQE